MNTVFHTVSKQFTEESNKLKEIITKWVNNWYDEWNFYCEFCMKLNLTEKFGMPSEKTFQSIFQMASAVLFYI